LRNEKIPPTAQTQNALNKEKENTILANGKNKNKKKSEEMRRDDKGDDSTHVSARRRRRRRTH
jgi:hypothetical protein